MSSITQNKPRNDLGETYCHISKARYIIKEDSFGNKYTAGLICDKCLNHEQLEPEKASDCKVLIYDTDKEGKVITIGQCCCYSKEHL